MNSKIFSFVTQKLYETWHLPKHQSVRKNLTKDSRLEDMPWTPARKEKFKSELEKTFGCNIELVGTVEELVNRTDKRYLHWFFGEVWQPRTENYYWTGWRIAEEICKSNPKRVLDVGCGYNPFKERIPNLIGIDPYNNCADYMVDIMEYSVGIGQHDHVIALGSINFNSREDIEMRFSKVVELLAPGGKLWMRANPGLQHDGKASPNMGPWVDVFPWKFSVAYELAEKNNLDLKTLKKDKDRLFFLFEKK